MEKNAKINWMEEELEMIGEERALMHTLRTRQRKWIGHTRIRGDLLLRMVIK